jgi:signal transduction histidine kinase
MDIPEILERTAVIIRACHPVEIAVEVRGEPFRLPGKAVANLMLIAQEAATNAVRHGSARRVVLRCDFTPEAVTVEVQDDGTGFVPESIPAEAGHYGLANMRGRIEMLGGSLSIESQPGQGARITARVPLPVAATPNHSTSE